jgi:hypothetical protein
MCATVCPSGALFFGTRRRIEELRPRSTPLNRFRFGSQTVTTKVNMMVPRQAARDHLDVTAAMHEASPSRIPLDLLSESLFTEAAS